MLDFVFIFLYFLGSSLGVDAANVDGAQRRIMFCLEKVCFRNENLVSCQAFLSGSVESEVGQGVFCYHTWNNNNILISVNTHKVILCNADKQPVIGIFKMSQ